MAAWEDALRAGQPILRHHRRQRKNTIIRLPPLTPRRRQACSPQETGCRQDKRCACASLNLDSPRTAPHPCQRRAKARCGASSIPESTTCAFCESCRRSDYAFFYHEELYRHADRRQASPASAERWGRSWSRKRLDPSAPDAQSCRTRPGGHDDDGHDAHGSQIRILDYRRAISPQRCQLCYCIIIPKSQHHLAVRHQADPCRKHSYDAE